jgi:hypothetical protein
MAANHPAAVAETRAHPPTDCVLAAQTAAELLEVRLAALPTLLESTEAARLEIRACRIELDRLATHAEGGASDGYWRRYRQSIGAIRTAAERLFAGEAWVVDVGRGPAWMPR